MTMKKEITLDEEEIKQIIKDRFGLKVDPILYFEGGILNPQKIRVVYYTSGNTTKLKQ